MGLATDADRIPRNYHRKVLVPIEPWEYNSPLLKYEGRQADLGLVAEALIYYDQVYVTMSSQREFEALVQWFVQQDQFSLLIRLLEERTLNIVNHAFLTVAANRGGVFEIWNIQTQAQVESPDFLPRIAYQSDLSYLNTERRERFFRALQPVVIDLKADDFAVAVEDARLALQDEIRYQLLIQAFTDEVAPQFGHEPPTVECHIERHDDGTFTVSTNLDFAELTRWADGRLTFRNEMPAIGEAQSNRLIWTASVLGHDLYLGNVMSTVTGNRLNAADRMSNTQPLIENLKMQVDFPDVRYAVNSNQFPLEAVMQVRQEGYRFRTWLQQEAERDRDALVAYHHEVAEAVGLRRSAGSVLKVFGYVTEFGAPFVPVLHPTLEAGLAGAAGVPVGEFIKRIGERVGREWRPVVFGNWIKREVTRRAGDTRPSE